jgi:hypothetical protein
MSEMDTKVDETKAESKKPKKNPLHELVPFTAFKDDGKYKDDIFVSVNGRRWQIKRGVEVKIPRYVYNYLMRSQAQNNVTYKFMEQKASEYDAAKLD